MNENEDLSLSLRDLIDSLNLPMTKSAEEEKDEKDEKEDKDDKKDEGEDKGNPFAKKDDKDKDESEDTEKKASVVEPVQDALTKSASELGAELAREVMEKAASMNKQTQAQTAGNTLADALLKKLASAGDLTTTNGITPGASVNKQQADMAQNVAEDDAKVKPMPTSDGLKPTGTINQIFDAMVADALAQGATGTDQVHEQGVAAAEGAELAHAVPNQVKVAKLKELLDQGVDYDEAAAFVKAAAAKIEDDMEKAAAIDSLVADGVPFEDAVELVKIAEEELMFEEAQTEKRAALDNLMEQGFDFDQAVELIKQASAGDFTTSNGIVEGASVNKVQADAAQQESEQAATIKPMLTSDGLRPTGTINEIFDAMVADALAQGATGTDQVHESGVAAAEGAELAHAVPNQVKVAKMNELMAGGMDYESAVELVKEASVAAMARKVGGAVKGAAKDLAENAKTLKNPGRLSNMPAGKVRGEAAKKMAKNPLVLGGAAAAAGAAGGAMLNKKAAFEFLTEQGVGFDEAMSMIDAKAKELAGE